MRAGGRHRSGAPRSRRSSIDAGSRPTGQATEGGMGLIAWHLWVDSASSFILITFLSPPLTPCCHDCDARLPPWLQVKGRHLVSIGAIASTRCPRTQPQQEVAAHRLAATEVVGVHEPALGDKEPLLKVQILAAAAVDDPLVELARIAQ